MSEFFISYLLLGFFSGILAGLFGIGGGIILVPSLAWLFINQGFADANVMLMAVSTSLATIIFTSLSSVLAHYKLGAIRAEIIRALAPAIFVGSMLGAAIAGQLSGNMLKTLFGLFLLLVS